MHSKQLRVDTSVTPAVLHGLEYTHGCECRDPRSSFTLQLLDYGCHRSELRCIASAVQGEQVLRQRRCCDVGKLVAVLIQMRFPIAAERWAGLNEKK